MGGMGAGVGMLVVETIAKIRRAFFVQKKPIKVICRELRVSRKVVRKVIRSEATEFRYERDTQPLPKLGPWREQLEAFLGANEEKGRRERLTLIRIFEELRRLGYQGSYDAVRRYAKVWRRERGTALAEAYVPLSFAAGEAYQFDWSHEIVVMNGVTVTVKVAHVRLCHSRMLFVRAYPRETQEMVFDAHDRAFAFFRGTCTRGIYDNLWTPPAARWFVGRGRHGMRESIRPLAGAIPLPALMGVRCLSPHNMNGLDGLVIDQALKRRSMPLRHQRSPRIHRYISGVFRRPAPSCRHIVLLSCQERPGDPRGLVGKRDERLIEAGARDDLFQPRRSPILPAGEPADDGTGAVN
jgi:transposase